MLGFQKIIDAAVSMKILKICIIVFAAGLLFRAVFVLESPIHPSLQWDAAHDAVIARNLAAGHGFSNEPGHPTAFRYPLYPGLVSIFFRLFGERFMVVYLWQAFMGALVCAGIAWLGYRASGGALAWCAGLLTAFNPELASFSRMMLTETLFSFLLIIIAVMAEYLLRERKRTVFLFLILGALFGLATLCRPVALAWSILFCLVVLLRKGMSFPRRILLLVTISVGCIAVITPWLVRNARVLGSPVLATSGGLTFWEYGHNDAVVSEGNTVVPSEFENANIAARPREILVYGGDPAQMVPIYNLMPRYIAYIYEQEVVDRLVGRNEVEADAEFNRMALEYVAEHPLRVFLESVRDLFSTFTFTEMNGKINPVLMWTMPFLVLGAYILWKRSRSVSLITFTCLASMFAVHFLFYFDHRFRVSYQPFFMLVGAAGVLAALKGRLTVRERVLLFGWWVVPVAVNYWMLWGRPSG